MKTVLALVMFFAAVGAQAQNIQPTADPQVCKTQDPQVVRQVQIGRVVNIDGAPWYVFPCKKVARRSTEDIRRDTEINIKTYLWQRGVL